jgi:hypothetical protein
MVKLHTTTNIRYFCKTVRVSQKSAITYTGSGTRWLLHIKKHGKEHIVTEFIQHFTNKDECISFCLSFSELYDIVADKQWANLIPEDGVGSNTGIPLSEEHKQKLRGRRPNSTYIHTDEHRKNISNGRKNIPVSESTKTKLSLANKGKKQSAHTIEKRKLTRNSRTYDYANRKQRTLKIIQRYNTSGQFVDENTAEYYISLGFTKSGISECCNNKRKKHKNFIWTFK